jgi:hypothetical protein
MSAVNSAFNVAYPIAVAGHMCFKTKALAQFSQRQIASGAAGQNDRIRLYNYFIPVAD